MKQCILFSGGWDSVAVAIKAPKEADLIFYNYGQIYFDHELESARKFAKEFNRKLIVIKLDLSHDIERRNYYLIMEAKRLGYGTIYTGNRNLIPLFDKYKDSNWWSIKNFGRLTNLKIKMPIVGWSKKKIVKFCMDNYKGVPYNCYFNRTDYNSCSCPNCKELRSLNLVIPTS